MSIKVMLADDHVLMREGIRQLLEFDGTISVIAEANNGVECMEQLLSIHPDILLLDINMPVMNGIEVLQEIKKKNISVKVFVLTGIRIGRLSNKKGWLEGLKIALITIVIFLGLSLLFKYKINIKEII